MKSTGIGQVSEASAQAVDYRFSVAPMLDWTDRHCRYFHRQLSRHARLYTEMITTGALIHGDLQRLLAFDESEHPLGLQLGGSDPAQLARVARVARSWGYDEINLNCGCPSDRVRHGSFGACLMAEPELVAECVTALRDAVDCPVTVKHRLGIDRIEEYSFVRDFVGTVARGGCEVFIVHARNAWLKGLNPRENREVPPLRYEYARRLKQDFPGLTIVLNGGLRSHTQIELEGAGVDGVMIGRAAYEEPWMLAQADARYFPERPAHPALTRELVVERMRAYALAQRARGEPLRAIVRHMLGLFNGLPGARSWRRTLSDANLLFDAGPELIDAALAAREAAARRSAGAPGEARADREARRIIG